MRETVDIIRQGVTATAVGLMFVLTVLSYAHDHQPGDIQIIPHWASRS